MTFTVTNPAKCGPIRPRRQRIINEPTVGENAIWRLLPISWSKSTVVESSLAVQSACSPQRKIRCRIPRHENQLAHILNKTGGTHWPTSVQLFNSIQSCKKSLSLNLTSVFWPLPTELNFFFIIRKSSLRTLVVEECCCTYTYYYYLQYSTVLQ